MSPFNNFLNKTNSYSFNNSWIIDAPLEHTWNELLKYKKWVAWCDSLLKVEPLNQFDRLQKGNHLKTVWKGALPYRVSFDAVINEITPYSFLSFNVTGDLYGKGICHFLPSDDQTTVNFIWNVSPSKLWMKICSPFAKSVFIENHDRIIAQAITGFAQMIKD